jgi:hypothetical protein
MADRPASAASVVGPPAASPMRTRRMRNGVKIVKLEPVADIFSYKLKLVNRTNYVLYFRKENTIGISIVYCLATYSGKQA